ncbi:MAG: AAA family ATPase [Actinomycetota bacterium]
MDNVARVVLGVEQHDVAEQVMHYLDRTGRARVVATAGDERQLEEAVRQSDPDVVVASPTLARAGGNGGPLFALETRESVASLRAAIRAGAVGYYLWPDEREALAGATARLRVSAPKDGKRGRVIAVHGPRGGAGATFVATHLAAAFARADRSCLLVDADPLFADLTTALGVPDDPSPRTLADLLPLVDELTPEHVADVAWAHGAGFRVLLAPEADVALRVEPRELRGVGWAAAHTSDVVLLHLPREFGEVARAALEQADRVLLVVALDVLSFRAGVRSIRVLDELGFHGRCDVVVNRARRSDLTPADVERAFGCAPLAVIPADPAVGPAQDRGRLLPARTRAVRAIDGLAADLLESP